MLYLDLSFEHNIYLQVNAGQIILSHFTPFHHCPSRLRMLPWTPIWENTQKGISKSQVGKSACWKLERWLPNQTEAYKAVAQFCLEGQLRMGTPCCMLADLPKYPLEINIQLVFPKQLTSVLLHKRPLLLLASWTPGNPVCTIGQPVSFQTSASHHWRNIGQITAFAEQFWQAHTDQIHAGGAIKGKAWAYRHGAHVRLAGIPLA